MNVQEFQNKLKEIQTIAKANGNSLTAIQIRDTFAGMELDKTQLLGVLKYLTSQGIQIEGMEDSATEETKEPERKKIPLTPEEETYLRNYLEELPELSIDTAQAFAALANGDQDALQSLTWYGLMPRKPRRNSKDGSRHECRGDFSCRSDPGGKSGTDPGAWKRRKRSQR